MAAAVAVGIFLSSLPLEGKSKSVLFIVTDTEGNATDVKDLKILITEGSMTCFSKSFDVMKGDAELTINLNELDGLINNWSKRTVKLFFSDGKVINAKILNESDIHYLTGTALIGDMEVPFKLKIDKLLSFLKKGFVPPKKGGK
jgi:hypothetical protein